MLSRWAYVLIGNNDTGKTSFQKHLVYDLSGLEYKKLTSNLVTDITHPRMPRGVAKLFTMNRSYQEKIGEYVDVSGFFSDHFKSEDICILASHTGGPSIDHLRDIIDGLHSRVYNVAGVFFSNGFNRDAKKIALLDWDERLWLKNPPADSDEEIQSQLARLAREFSQMLIARASVS